MTWLRRCFLGIQRLKPGWVSVQQIWTTDWLNKNCKKRDHLNVRNVSEYTVVGRQSFNCDDIAIRNENN